MRTDLLSTTFFDTFVFNLLGGPGTGKSTTAAMLFARLKLAGFVAELVTEKAKDLTWEKHPSALRCAPYVFGNQLWRMERLRGQVEVIVTDSPLILSNIYAEDESAAFHQLVREKHASFRRADVFLKRVKPYQPIGRNQTQAEAEAIDRLINTMGCKFALYAEASEDAADVIFRRFKDEIRGQTDRR